MDVKTCTWLLEDVIDFEANARVGVLFADDTKFLYHLAQSVDQVDVFDRNHHKLLIVEDEIGQMDNLTIHNAVYPDEPEGYDHIIMLAPKGRDFAQAQLWRALHSLKRGGSVYIAGATKEGAKAVISDAKALFGKANTLIYKRSHRVGQAFRPDDLPELPHKWGTADPSQPQERVYTTPVGDVPVMTMPGVFSWEALDKGTQYLLETFDFASLNPDNTVLDVGCGVGIIGAIAARHAAAVTLVDDNLLAVRCAQGTLEQNKLTHASAHASDVYTALDNKRYHLIVCNPPFHKEFDVNTNVAMRVIREAAAHLHTDGRLLMVCNTFLRYEDTMREHFSSVSVTAEGNRFKVLVGYF
jgi:16S rRNA (guanine1207-N2)-methyltransferase